MDDIKEQSKQNFWGTPEFEQAPPSPPPTAEGASAAPGAAPVTPAVKREVFEAGARAMVASINFVQCMLGRPVVNWKYKRQALQRMTEEERDAALEALYMDIEPEDEQGKKCKSMMEKIIEKQEMVAGKLPFNEKEKQDLVEAWTEYGMITGKPMDPKMLVILTTGGTLGKRIIDIAFE